MMRPPASFDFDSLFEFVAGFWPPELRRGGRRREVGNVRVLSGGYRPVDVELEVEELLGDVEHLMIYLNVSEAIRVVAQRALDDHNKVRIAEIDRGEVRRWFEGKISEWTFRHGKDIADLPGRERYYRDNKKAGRK